MSTDYTFSSELFFDELLRVSSSIVWKNETAALAYEDQERQVIVEQYILARQGRLTFETVFEFEEDVLRSFNMSSEEVVNCTDDKYRIPIEIRELCAERQAEWLIENYEEQNNYYRMLNGLPDLEDTDYFYNTDYMDISDSVTPLHKLSASEIRLLEVNGYLDKLIKENPSKKYLQHLTDKKIDIYKARNSKAFSILWITDSDSDNMIENFMDTYNEAKTMIMNVFYQKMMSVSNTQYTGFIGMMILFQTIMLMQKSFLDADISRDFYDVESLRLVYDSYDVPFYQNIPLEYHKKIVKNINILLSHKGSTRVFYDLFDVFGFNDITLYSFYMIKKRRLGNNKKPVIVLDENGKPDRQKMYDIDFAKVPLYSDPNVEIRNPRNQVRYSELTINDKYWITDKNLLDKIFGEEFNYMESKYLGIQLTSNLMQIIYETTYYLKMILDNRHLLAATTLYNSALHSNMNIFDMVIYLSALITKKYGYEGNIPKDPHEIGSVMGFNFKLDLEVLKKNIKKDDFLKKDKRLLTLLETMDVGSLASVKKVYTNLVALRKYLVKKMADTDNVEEYWAYYRLYESIMYSEYTEETFKKSDGEVASSFADMLADINPALYSRYLSLDDNELNNEIVNMLYLAKSSCNALKHIQYADSVNITTIIEYLFKLLEFFKSAKADLTGYEIVYSLISDADNVIKLMNYIDRIYDDYTEQPIYSIFDELTDMIAWIKDRMSLRDKYKMIDELPYQFHISMKAIVSDLDDYIKKCVSIFYELVDSVQLSDWISDHKEITVLKDDLPLKDQLFTVFEELKGFLLYRVYDEFPLFDDIISIIDKYLEQPLDQKFIIISKIVTIFEAQRIGKSDYTMDDEMALIRTKDDMKLQYKLIDKIIQIYEDHHDIVLDVSVEDILDHMTMNIRVDDDATIRDIPSKVREIFLIVKDIKKNRLTYIDALSTSMLKYFIDEQYTLKDEMKFTDESEMESDLPYIIDYFTDHREITVATDPFTLKDQIFSMYDQATSKMLYKVFDEFNIFDEIVAVYKERLYDDDIFPMDSVMAAMKTVMCLNDKNISLDDDIPEIHEIAMIVKDINENRIAYVDRIMSAIMKYYVEDPCEIQEELQVTDRSERETKFPYMIDFITRLREFSLVTDHFSLKDQMFSLFDDAYSRTFQRVFDKFPICDEIVSIYKERNYCNIEFPIRPIIESMKSLIYLNDKNTDIKDDIPYVHDIISIVKDVRENTLEYGSKLLIKYMQYHANTKFLIDEDVSLKEIIYELPSIFLPYMNDHVKMEKEKAKAGSSKIGWGEKLYLVYEEQFEDD